MSVQTIADLKLYVNDNIKQNGIRSITGSKHNKALIDTIDTLYDLILNSGGGGHVIQEEGVSLPQRANLNFVGVLVTAGDNSGTGTTTVTISTPTAGQITVGVFPDSVVQSSNVTQHVGDIDHDSLLNYEADEHIPLNDLGTGTDSVWSAAKIITEIATGGGGGHTIQDDGSDLAQRSNLNFTGNLVISTDDSGNDASVVTISYDAYEIVATANLSTFTVSSNTTFNLSASNLAAKIIEVSMDQAFAGNLTFTNGVKGTNYIVRLTTSTTAYSPLISLSATAKLRSGSSLIAPNSGDWVHDYNVTFDGTNYWISPDYDQT